MTDGNLLSVFLPVPVNSWAEPANEAESLARIAARYEKTYRPLCFPAVDEGAQANRVVPAALPLRFDLTGIRVAAGSALALRRAFLSRPAPAQGARLARTSCAAPRFARGCPPSHCEMTAAFTLSGKRVGVPPGRVSSLRRRVLARDAGAG